MVKVCIQSESCPSELQLACFKRNSFYFEGKLSHFQVVMHFSQFHYTSGSRWPVFVDKSATNVQTAGVRSNKVATKSITRFVPETSRLLPFLHYDPNDLWTNVWLLPQSFSQQLPSTTSNQLRNTHFPPVTCDCQIVTGWSLNLEL